MSPGSHFLSLHLHFHPRTLLSETHALSLLVEVSVHTYWFGFWFHFWFLASGDFPYFLVNSVIHLKEYLVSLTQNFQMFLCGVILICYIAGNDQPSLYLLSIFSLPTSSEYSEFLFFMSHPSPSDSIYPFPLQLRILLLTS